MRYSLGFLSLISLLTVTQAAFACRLEGMMGPEYPSEATQQEESAFLKSVLVEDENSLQKESAVRQPKDGVQESYDLEDLSGVVRKYGSPDGWGIVHYPCPVEPIRLPRLNKSIKPAFADADFKQAVNQTTSERANIVMAHVRQASPECKQVELVNVHPFTWQNWSFMHNGTVSGAFSPVVAAKISQYKDKIGGEPKGTTDSERVFYFFLANLYEKAGTLDSKKIPLSTIQTVFAQSINALIANSTPTAKPLHGDVMDVQGHLQTQPACNFLLSDGTHLLAFRKVLNLYLAQKTLANQQKLYLVSSEKTQTHDPADPSVKWLLLPENHILIISWDAQGNPKPALEPLFSLAP